MAYIHHCPFCQTELGPEMPRCPKCGAENYFYGVDMSGDEFLPKGQRFERLGAPADESASAPDGEDGPAAPAAPNASTSQCPYCGSTLRSDEKVCPNCGAENASYVQDMPRRIVKPRTIEELQEYCAERGMPLLRMRFFIGEDYREPKAFGIFRDGEDVVVYKNKADGSRAIRYRGRDEEHAVDELFQKLLDECHSRGIYPDGETPRTRSSGGSSSSSGGGSKLSRGVVGTLFGLFVLTMVTEGAVLSYILPILILGALMIPLEIKLRDRFTPAGSDHPAPLRPWIIGGFFLSAVIVLSGVGIFNAHQTRMTRIAYEKLHEDDGYYDFDDGYIYYSSAENWFCAEETAQETLWDPAGSTQHTEYGAKLFALQDGSSRTIRDQKGAVPVETQEAFLGKEHQADWSFDAYSLDLRRENAAGYYDLGDGALYYLERTGESYHHGQTYKLYYTTDSAADGSWYLIQKISCPADRWDPEELRLRDGSSLPYSAQARLSRSYQEALGFSPYNARRVKSIQTGYYDFGDGRLYYYDRSGAWHYRSSGTGSHNWSSGDSSYVLSLGDGSSTAPDEWGAAYQGSAWDYDWEGYQYTEPSSSGSRSSSGSSSSSDWDDWDSDDTDWDSDW